MPLKIPTEIEANFSVLDLSAELDALAAACRSACEDHGFFYILNHGVPEELITAHAAAQRSFFALPMDLKLSLLADENNRGWTPLGEETLDPKNSSQGDLKEGLYFGREIAANSDEAALPLHGPNKWPNETLLPGYRKITEEYLATMTKLGFRLLSVVARALNLPDNYFEQFFSRPMTFLRPLRYVPTASAEEDGKFAAGAHSDYGFMTILWTDGTPGLQIFHRGAWMDVPPLEGAFIVNIGDMLERWTAGRFASTVHRVVNPGGKERLSCAFFFEPSFDACVAPLPGQGQPDDILERYPPTTAGQHLLNKYSQTHAAYKEKVNAGVTKV